MYLWCCLFSTNRWLENDRASIPHHFLWFPPKTFTGNIESAFRDFQMFWKVKNTSQISLGGLYLPTSWCLVVPGCCLGLPRFSQNEITNHTWTWSMPGWAARERSIHTFSPNTQEIEAIYTYIYLCGYRHLQTIMYVYIYTYLHIYIHIYIYMCVPICALRRVLSGAFYICIDMFKYI